MNIVELYNRGWLGIQLKPGLQQMELEGKNEDGQPIKQIVEANRIYQVSFLDVERGMGIFDIDEENSVAFHINENVWEYTSTYSGVLS